MFNWFNWHKKESPLLGSLGLGGGVASILNIAAPTAPVVGDHFEFQVWGGGGGSGGGGNGPGGGGAYVSVQYKILKGTTLRFIVGSGGRFFSSGSLNETAYGGGGGKGSGSDDYDVSTGAGLSGIFITDNALYSAASPLPSRTTSGAPETTVGPGLTVANCLIVAAGGGGGGAAGSPSGGGGGGITAGGDGAPITGAGAGVGGTWGGEGTDTGTAGTPGGFAFAGGQTPSGGGGGGSGLYGGGGGSTGSKIGQGAGGSSYYWTTQSKPPAFVSYNPTSINSAGGNPGYAASLAGRVGGGPAPNNPGSFGAGGGPNGSGGDGRIAYRRHDSYEQLPLAEWVILDYTGDTQSLVV